VTKPLQSFARIDALTCCARLSGTLSIAGKATEIKAMRLTVDTQLFNNNVCSFVCSFVFMFISLHHTTTEIQIINDIETGGLPEQKGNVKSKTFVEFTIFTSWLFS